MFTKLFCKVYLYFKISKWIRRTKRRQLLVEVFNSIMMTHREKTCSTGKMFQFCELASKENLLPGDLMELQEWLQEISNMNNPAYFPMRRFLGTKNPIIGGTMCDYWTREKMENFLLHVNSWKGLLKNVTSFTNRRFNDISSNIISTQGHNGGNTREVEILAIVQNNGVFPSDMQETIKAIALTPRQHWREQLASSSSSVGSTPLNTFRSSIGSTPLNTPREQLASSMPLNTPRSSISSPREHLCSSPYSEKKSIVLQWFMNTKGKQNFNMAMKEACEGMNYAHPSLVQIYDIVRYHQQNFSEATQTNPIARKVFLEKLSNCRLIQITLQASPFFKSIEQVVFDDDKIQIMFIEGLIFSFFQVCRKPFQLGISKIIPNSDGDGFSISLFPQHLIDIYLENLPKIFPFHSTQMIEAA